MKPTDEQTIHEKAPKRVYHSPQLRVYGDVGELTQAGIGMDTLNDTDTYNT